MVSSAVLTLCVPVLRYVLQHAVFLVGAYVSAKQILLRLKVRSVCVCKLNNSHHCLQPVARLVLVTKAQRQSGQVPAKVQHVVEKFCESFWKVCAARRWHSCDR